MALKSELMAAGLPPALANRLGYDLVANFTAAGTTQATATTLTSNNANVTTSSVGAGVVLGSAEQKFCVFNAGPSTLTVYPPVGVAFTGLAANAGIQVAANNTVKTEGGGLAGMPWVTS